MSILSGKTVTVEVDMDEVVDGLTDAELRDVGLMRIDSLMAQRHEELFYAIDRGDLAAFAKAAESLAWEQYGRILPDLYAALVRLVHVAEPLGADLDEDGAVCQARAALGKAVPA